jgi:hypothetical protein
MAITKIKTENIESSAITTDKIVNSAITTAKLASSVETYFDTQYSPIDSSRIVLHLTPQSIEPPSTNFATIDLRNSHPVLDFDTTTQETAIWSGVIPSTYANNGLKVVIAASLTSATSGTLGWDIAFEEMNGFDIDGDGFATAVTVTAATVPATSGQVMQFTKTILHSEMDGLNADDSFRIRIRRDVANDTATGDAEFISGLVVMI